MQKTSRYTKCSPMHKSRYSLLALKKRT